MTTNKISNNVRFWETRTYVGKKKTTYTIRWTVDGNEFHDTFDTVALAEAELSKLRVAASQGVGFDTATGRPVTEEAASVPWYDFAIRFIDVKWKAKRSSGHSRADRADALVGVTMHLLTEPLPPYIGRQQATVALREWAFNTERRPNAPAEVAEILNWIQKHSKPISIWADAEARDELLEVVDSKLDGTPAAPSTAGRKRRMLHNGFQHAVRWKYLKDNPLASRTSPKDAKTSSALDKRRLPSEKQADQILAWIEARPRGGKRLHAYFATLRYAPTRPEELASVEVGDVTLPEKGWGNVVVHDPAPEVGRQWTDSGDRRDERPGMKGRAVGTTRIVPFPQALVQILRAHIEREGLKEDDLLFRGEHGGPLASVVCRRALDSARKAVLTERQYKSPVLKRVYDFRHLAITTSLNAGVDVATVAEWAGNSIAVIQATYWQVLEGRQQELFEKVDWYLAGNPTAETGDGDGSNKKTAKKKPKKNGKKKDKKPKGGGGGQAGTHQNRAAPNARTDQDLSRVFTGSCRGQPGTVG